MDPGAGDRVGVGFGDSNADSVGVSIGVSVRAAGGGGGGGVVGVGIVPGASRLGVSNVALKSCNSAAFDLLSMTRFVSAKNSVRDCAMLGWQIMT